MHITVETESLKKIVDTASRVSAKHVALPVLQCLLLKVEGSTLQIKATNLEIGIEGNVTAHVEEDGVVAVPAHVLLQTIALVPQKEITLSTEGDVLIVQSASSNTEIKSMPFEDFPNIPHLECEPLRMGSAQFALGVKTTAFTASQSSIKPELGSIYIHQKKEHALTFVATDSFRLMEKTISQKNLVLNESILIPYKNALELARIAESDDGEIDFYIGENQCALRVGDVYVTSRLISGSFPDYEQIIPKEYKSTAITLTNDLAHALKKTNIFLNKFMQLGITVSEKGITVSSQSGEYGSTTESIPATLEGEEISLNFNQRYVSEVLQHIQDESIKLKFAGIGRPLVIENVHDRSLRYLVMPMNK